MTNKSKYNRNSGNHKGLPQRRSIRLKGYDYSQAGLYFITICVQNRACLFGEIENGQMQLNDAGTMVENEWLKLPERFKNIQLHEYIVMPNHFHAILEIVVGATLVVAQNDGNAPKGQPQGIAPTVAQNDGNAPKGQPQGIAPTDTQNDGNAPKGQPQGIAPTDTENDGNAQQPQGIAPTGKQKNKTVGDMVGAFQSIVTVEYIRGVKTLDWQPFDGKLWQRNYWEHIIRNELSYQRISEYIINNPTKWTDDKLFIE